MRLSLMPFLTVILMASVWSCGDSSAPAVKTDVMVELRSHAGNTIVIPSMWSADDRGDTWNLKSPDGQVVLTIWTFTVEGSGSFDQFRDRVSGEIVKDKAFKPSEWQAITIGERPGFKQYFETLSGEQKEASRLYVIQTGDYYHAMWLRATPIALRLNGLAYEQFIQSFRGIGARSPKPGQG